MPFLMVPVLTVTHLLIQCYIVLHSVLALPILSPLVIKFDYALFNLKCKIIMKCYKNMVYLFIKLQKQLMKYMLLFITIFLILIYKNKNNLNFIYRATLYSVYEMHQLVYLLSKVYFKAQNNIYMAV